jgi:hypothetical protein
MLLDVGPWVLIAFGIALVIIGAVIVIATRSNNLRRG